MTRIIIICEQVPVEKLHRALQRDQRFCVWGMPDLHVQEYALERGYIATHCRLQVDPFYATRQEVTALGWLSSPPQFLDSLDPPREALQILLLARMRDSEACIRMYLSNALVLVTFTLALSGLIHPLRTHAHSAVNLLPQVKTKTDPLFNCERPRLFYLQKVADVIDAINKSRQGPRGAPTTDPATCLSDDGPVPGFYVLSVFPGKDYVHHYARMVHQVPTFFPVELHLHL
jgi:hypothetical protein